jgi:hypothetical protein
MCSIEEFVDWAASRAKEQKDIKKMLPIILMYLSTAALVEPNLYKAAKLLGVDIEAPPGTFKKIVPN